MVNVMDRFTRATSALSDKTRLRIINLLASRECCVCEVMQALDISQTRASRNLKILNDAEFLIMRTDGQYTLYSLSDDINDFHFDLLKTTCAAIDTTSEAQIDIERLKQSKRVELKYDASTA